MMISIIIVIIIINIIIIIIIIIITIAIINIFIIVINIIGYYKTNNKNNIDNNVIDEYATCKQTWKSNIYKTIQANKEKLAFQDQI